MKKLILTIALGIFSFLQLQAQNGVAISTSSSATPDASAILDVQSTSQGMLIPRVDITDLATAAPVSSPATSLMVYNTNTTTGPGFFYWDGSAWVVTTGAKKLNDLSDVKVVTGTVTSYYFGLNSPTSATGESNVGIGDYALNDATSAKQNMAIGNFSLDALTTGSYNMAFGYSSGEHLKTGDHNIIVGLGIDVSTNSTSNELNIGNAIYGTNIYPSAADAHIGINNQAPDASAALDITSTTSGLLIPRMDKSQRDNITSPATGLMIYQTDNTPGFYYYNGSAWVSSDDVGAKALNDLSDVYRVSSSYFIGYRTGSYPSGTSENIVIGENALGTMDDGNNNNNIAIGYNVGNYNFSTGSNNIMIGKEVQRSADGVSNELNIGKAIYATGLYGTAKVGIGNGHNAPKSTLDVGGSLSLAINNGGTVTLGDDDYTYLVTSSGATVTLPDATTMAGRVYLIKLTASGTATVGTTGSQNIDASTTYTLSGQYKYVQVQSTGSNWIIIGKN